MAELALDSLSKTYAASPLPALDRLTLRVGDGAFVALLGPSGCGKTTCLRMIAGLETPSTGAIRIGGRDVTRAAPRDRDVGLAFENYALYPPLTVYDNLAFNLKARGLPAAEIRQRVGEIAERMHIEDILNLQPAALGSGQKQRVNIARALVRRPAVLLLDEPLSHLDARLRLRLRTEIKRLHGELRFTTVLVTHDQQEAMALADRIAVLRDGVLQQYADPHTIFNKPANAFVADFIGEPPMNLLPVRVSPDREWLELPDGTFRLPLDARLRAGLPDGPGMLLGIRPQHISVAATADAHTVPGRISVVENLGDETQLGLRYGEHLLLVHLPYRGRHTAGETVHLRLAPDNLHLFPDKRGP